MKMIGSDCELAMLLAYIQYSLDVEIKTSRARCFYKCNV